MSDVLIRPAMAADAFAIAQVRVDAWRTTWCCSSARSILPTEVRERERVH